MTLHQQSPLAISKESRPRVVSQVEQVENSPTKTSFMKLPPSMNANSNKSHYGAVIQEAADNHADINIKQLPNPATLPTSKPTISTSAYAEDLISIPKPDKLDDFKLSSVANTTNPAVSDETQQHVLLGNKLDAGDSYLGFLRNKKAAETGLYSNGIANTSVISDPKLKKATNPSIASLRGISESGVSTPTGTISKGSSRAEFFAAKLHDAIKDDKKNKDDSNETFVYDTTTSNAVANEPELDFSGAGTGASVSTKVRDDAKSTTITDCHSSIVSPSEANTVHQGSPYFNKFTIDDGFDLMSKSSINSKNVSQRKSSKETASDEVHNVQQMSKVDEQHPNQLRQITSKLFDSKGVQPRRYSGVQNDISQNGDSFDEDFEYYGGSNILNTNINNLNHPSTLGSTQNANIIYSIGENDSDFEDDLSTYFDKNYQRGNHLLQSSDINNNRNNNSNNGNNNNSNSNSNSNTNTNTNTNNYNSHHLQFLHDGIFRQKYDENNEPVNTNKNSISNLNYNYNNPYFHLNDYGSITNDNKSKQRRKRSDIYVSPHDFTSLRTQRIRQVKSFCYTAIGIISLLFIGFVFGFILATNKELQAVEVVEVTDVIVGQEVFIFDMIIDAFNPGILPIFIKNVQLDIFAKTMYVIDDEPNNDPKKKYETVLLGSIEQLEIPLSFEGGFITRQHDISVTEVKLLNPCSFDDDNGDDDNNNNNNNDDDNNDENDNIKTKINYKDNDGDINRKEINTLNGGLSISKSSPPYKVVPPSSKWLNISRNPFDLIIRGAMLYELPLSSNNHTVSISYTTYIDPNNLEVGY